MHKTWKKKDEYSSSNEGITSPNRSSDHTSRLGFTILKKVRHQRVQSKGVTKVRTLNPLVISVIKRGTLLMHAE